jgi:hypothetical protein
MKMKCGMKQMKCTGKKDHDQKPSSKCNNNPDCTFCPVCSVFTFPPHYELSLKYFFFKKNYPLISSGNIASYIPPVWKPPNSHFLYS